jgi:U3 small nucleolar RNA-associated protein 19
MLDAENSKDVKKTPVIEYVIPKRIFKKQDIGSEVEDSLLAKLWELS